MTDFDTKKTRRQFNSLPTYIKSADDLVRFCRQLQHELVKSNHLLDWYMNKFTLSEADQFQYREIYDFHDMCFECDTSKFMDFDEFLLATQESSFDLSVGQTIT